jgi:hypothetical protein
VRKTRRLSLVGLLMATAGVALFAWLVYYVGPAGIWSSFRQIGWGLILIVALGGLRFAARTEAWCLCVEPPAHLRFRDAFAAVVSGDALGNLTPLGPIVSEPAKAAFVRGRVPLGPAVTALAIENVLYTLSAAAMITAGMMALLFSVTLPAAVRDLSEAAVVAMLAVFAIALGLLWRRPAVISRALSLVSPSASPRLERIRALEQEIYTFASRRRAAMVPLIATELLFHALGVLEIHVTLWFMRGTPPPVLTSFILETVNRVVVAVFKVVPLQVGVNEAGTALGTEALGLGAAAGVTLGIVRKTRMLIWMLAGTALLVRHGLTPRMVLDDVELRAGKTEQ